MKNAHLFLFFSAFNSLIMKQTRKLNDNNNSGVFSALIVQSIDD
jgi:hypothetical protein